MEEKFVKEIKIIDKNKYEKYNELMQNIEKVKKSLEANYINMQFIKDRDLIDYYTYKIKSEEAQYDFLVQKAKVIEDELGGKNE